MSRLIQKYINVNTKFRPYVKGEQPKSTDFLVSLPNPISNVVSMKLKTFNSPNAEYTFDIGENNNTFEVIDTTGPTTTSISISPGSYTSDQLKVNVNTALTTAGLANIELDYITPIPPPSGGLGMFAFKSVPPTTINNYEINFDVNVNSYIYETFGWKLGFRKSYYSANTEYQKNPFPNQNCPQKFGNIGGLSVFNGLTLYLADTPIAMPNTSSYYLLSINDFLNHSDLTFHEACFPSNNIMDNIFARIDTSYSLNNNTLYETDTGEPFKRVYSGPVTLSKLHIKLYDDNNNILDLNNADYSFLLELEVKM